MLCLFVKRRFLLQQGEIIHAFLKRDNGTIPHGWFFVTLCKKVVSGVACSLRFAAVGRRKALLLDLNMSQAPERIFSTIANPSKCHKVKSFRVEFVSRQNVTVVGPLLLGWRNAGECLAVE